jgi:superfamily II DNA or RNA helicase
MELRPYQNEILNRIRNSYATGHNSPTLVLGCGGGKSCIAAEMTKLSIEKGKEVLVLLHRIELQEQLTDTFTWWGVNMEHCTIGMVQSISRKLEKIKPPDFIITDERTPFFVKYLYKDI